MTLARHPSLAAPAWLFGGVRARHATTVGNTEAAGGRKHGRGAGTATRLKPRDSNPTAPKAQPPLRPRWRVFGCAGLGLLGCRNSSRLGGGRHGSCGRPQTRQGDSTATRLKPHGSNPPHDSNSRHACLLKRPHACRGDARVWRRRPGCSGGADARHVTAMRLMSATQRSSITRLRPRHTNHTAPATRIQPVCGQSTRVASRPFGRGLPLTPATPHTSSHTTQPRGLDTSHPCAGAHPRGAQPRVEARFFGGGALTSATPHGTKPQDSNHTTTGP